MQYNEDHAASFLQKGKKPPKWDCDRNRDKMLLEIKILLCDHEITKKREKKKRGKKMHGAIR